MDLSLRPRRLRQNPQIREMVAETALRVQDLMYPIFVTDGKGLQSPHRVVPGILTISIDKLPKLMKEVQDLGILSVLLFGVTQKKDARGSEALNKSGPVLSAIKLIRENFPQIQIATDIALDPYTDHGHDGIFENGSVQNDATIEVLAKMSILHAQAGAQIVAPSDMMDGRVAGIREELDDASLENTLILSYTAKYASALYGPFRETLDAKPIGDKKTYQMDYRNRREALRELELDLAEGADMVMIKPASWYQDIIADFKARSEVPVVAYHVSGEAAMIEVGAQAGLFDRDRAILECLLGIKRAGADLIATYHALDAARILKSIAHS